MTIALIDYGAGNLRSVANALAAVGAKGVTVTHDPDDVAHADRIILPGVGSFAQAMAGLGSVPGLIAALDRRVRGDGVPFLGICVGMQILATNGHEHGTTAGLNWIGGDVIAMDAKTRGVRVPHMGWNRVVGAHPLIPAGEAYFLHSYHLAPQQADDIAATSDHGGPIVAAVARNNILGVQFHPEKSGDYGLALLRQFVDWTP